MRPGELTLSELRSSYEARTLSPRECVSDIVARIESLNPALNAFATLTPDLALEQATVAEQAFLDPSRDLSDLPPLLGVPITVKDLIATAGIRTTYGSHAFENNVPIADAVVARRLRDAGAVILGKTTTPEFGWKSPTESPLLGITRNPWALDRTPAGSSGGSAVAVACGMGPVGVGTDGGGSLRQPASFCGVVGFKPSFGRVPCAPSGGLLDTFNATGPLARTTADVALLLGVIAGEDEEDPYSLPSIGQGWGEGLHERAKGLRVAWSADLGYAPVEPEVAEVASAAARLFEALGCRVEAIDPPWGDPAGWFDILCMQPMALSLKRHYDDTGGRMDPGLVELIRVAETLTAEAIAEAASERVQLQRQALTFFSSYDLLLTPTMSILPFSVGVDQPTAVAGKPVAGMQWTPFTYPLNITGFPAISVPAGWSRDGLPIGLQIAGGFRQDRVVLRAAQALETAQPWRAEWPPIVSGEPGDSRPRELPSRHASE